MKRRSGNGHTRAVYRFSCRKCLGGLSPSTHSWALTGKTRALTKAQRARERHKTHLGVEPMQYGYRCLDCGHVGFTRSSDAVARAKLRRRGFE